MLPPSLARHTRPPGHVVHNDAFEGGAGALSSKAAPCTYTNPQGRRCRKVSQGGGARFCTGESMCPRPTRTPGASTALCPAVCCAPALAPTPAAPRAARLNAFLAIGFVKPLQLTTAWPFVYARAIGCRHYRCDRARLRRGGVPRAQVVVRRLLHHAHGAAGRLRAGRHQQPRVRAPHQLALAPANTPCHLLHPRGVDCWDTPTCLPRRQPVPTSMVLDPSPIPHNPSPLPLLAPTGHGAVGSDHASPRLTVAPAATATVSGTRPRTTAPSWRAVMRPATSTIKVTQTRKAPLTTRPRATTLTMITTSSPRSRVAQGPVRAVRFFFQRAMCCCFAWTAPCPAQAWIGQRPAPFLPPALPIGELGCRTHSAFLATFVLVAPCRRRAFHN